MSLEGASQLADEIADIYLRADPLCTVIMNAGGETEAKLHIMIDGCEYRLMIRKRDSRSLGRDTLLD